MVEVPEPACGCVGCDVAQIGRQVHGQINELRRMIDERDQRLERIYNVAGRSDETVVREPEFPNRYPGGKY